MAIHNLALSRTAAAARVDYRPTAKRLSAAAPLRLNGESGGWLVEGGQVDLFAVALADDEPSGARYPVCSIAPGELIWSFPWSANSAVIAVGRLDTAVTRLSTDDLAAWSPDRSAKLIESWLGQIAAAAFGDRVASPANAAEAGRRLSLSAGQRLHASRGAVWVGPRSGKLFVGDGPTAFAGMTPIAAGLSLRAGEDC